MVDKVDKIWMDGQLVDWDAAQVHVLSHTLHYGLGAFEGIRCYEREDGRSSVFRLQEHVERLFESALIATIPMRWSQEEVTQACIHTVRANGLKECYLRPLVFLGDGAMGLFGRGNPTRLAIAAWKWGAYLGDEGIDKGIRVKVSSYARPSINSVMSKAKVVGNYVNSILAKREVVDAGYQEAIMLDAQGYVAEGSGENIFIVKRGQVITPPLSGAILGGITRDTVIHLCAELKLPLVERQITRDELYVANEIFLTGTAAEITPVREIDDRMIGAGSRGPITKQIQDRFFAVVRGRDVTHPEWLAFV